jgi:hypothetical protein
MFECNPQKQCGVQPHIKKTEVMKMRKKSIAIILAMIMVFSASIAVYASAYHGNPETANNAEISDVFKGFGIENDRASELVDLFAELGVVVPQGIAVNEITLTQNESANITADKIYSVDEARARIQANQVNTVSALDLEVSIGKLSKAQLEEFSLLTGFDIADLANVPVYNVFGSDEGFNALMANALSIDDLIASGKISNITIEKDGDNYVENILCNIFGCPGTQSVLNGFVIYHNVLIPSGRHFDCTVWAHFSDNCTRCGKTHDTWLLFMGMANC